MIKILSKENRVVRSTHAKELNTAVSQESLHPQRIALRRRKWCNLSSWDYPHYLQ